MFLYLQSCSGEELPRSCACDPRIVQSADSSRVSREGHHIHIHIYIYIYTYIHTYTHIHVYMYMHNYLFAIKDSAYFQCMVYGILKCDVI